jgi:hypothetical protein
MHHETRLIPLDDAAPFPPITVRHWWRDLRICLPRRLSERCLSRRWCRSSPGRLKGRPARSPTARRGTVGATGFVGVKDRRAVHTGPSISTYVSHAVSRTRNQVSTSLTVRPGPHAGGPGVRTAPGGPRGALLRSQFPQTPRSGRARRRPDSRCPRVVGGASVPGRFDTRPRGRLPRRATYDGTCGRGGQTRRPVGPECSERMSADCRGARRAMRRHWPGEPSNAAAISGKSICGRD